ncbi:MAG: TetR/AcrR family transcriptional regulator [Chloroflexota bacterium]|nr:TetR/AcrR family transcriptional regulator [Chloroflexota bacterium]
MTAARDQIIEVTCALMEIQGYHATGLNQIISESGRPKGSLYHYFPGGKEELVSAALTRTGISVLNRIRDSLATVPDHGASAAADAVRGFLHQLAYYVEASGYKQGGPITTVALETAATSERLRTECHAIYESWRGAFVDKLIAAGIADERAGRLSLLILASIEGGIILCRVQQSADPLREMGDELHRLIAVS